MILYTLITVRITSGKQSRDDVFGGAYTVHVDTSQSWSMDSCYCMYFHVCTCTYGLQAHMDLIRKVMTEEILNGHLM